MGEPYLRKKNDKWIIEQKIDGKTKYLVTLPPIEEVLELVRLDKASKDYVQDNIKEAETFALSSLNELSNEQRTNA